MAQHYHGTALSWHSMAWHGMEWRGMEWNGVAWNGIALYSTAVCALLQGMLRAWSTEHGARSMEHGAWSMEHGAHVQSCCASMGCAIQCYAMPCYAMACYAMLCHPMPCYAIPCYAIPCYAIPCYAAMLRHPMLCRHAAPYIAVPCFNDSWATATHRAAPHRAAQGYAVGCTTNRMTVGCTTNRMTVGCTTYRMTVGCTTNRMLPPWSAPAPGGSCAGGVLRIALTWLVVQPTVAQADTIVSPMSPVGADLRIPTCTFQAIGVPGVPYPQPWQAPTLAWRQDTLLVVVVCV